MPDTSRDTAVQPVYTPSNAKQYITHRLKSFDGRGPRRPCTCTRSAQRDGCGHYRRQPGPLSASARRVGTDGPPSRIALCRRGSSQPPIRMEGREVSFGTGSACPNYLDPRTGERRPFTEADVIGCVRSVDALPELDFCMSMGMPSDLNPRAPYCDEFALMLENTTKPFVFTLGSRQECEAIVGMAAAAAGGMDALRLSPNLLGYGQPTTPLLHGEDSTDKLIYMAEVGLPMVHQSSPMMGGAAPVSMAAALALGNAELLSGLVIHQLVRRGAPFVYGCGLHHMDMRTTIAVYGAPEFELARAAVTEMARYYDLPALRLCRLYRQLRDGRTGGFRRDLIRHGRTSERPAPGARRGLR